MHKINLEQGMLSEAEVASLLGVSCRWLQEDRKKNNPIIPFVKLGRIRKYPKQLVESSLQKLLVA